MRKSYTNRFFDGLKTASAQLPPQAIIRDTYFDDMHQPHNMNISRHGASGHE